MVATVSAVERRVSATKFKATCLALLDEVAATGETIVVTKHGKPVARVTAVEPPPSLEGSVTFLVGVEELIAPLDVEWDAVKGHL